MIKFGPSGNSESFFAAGYEHTEQAAAFVRERGLSCYEYSFGRGVRLTEQKAHSIGEAFRAQDVEISVHAPYFVNFANPDPLATQKSCEYVLGSARAGRAMGGRRVVFHPASQGKEARDSAFSRTLDRIKVLRDLIYESALESMIFCPETMGKSGQIGTVEEIARICEIDPVFTPCVDFGHVNALEQGSLKTARDFSQRLEFLIDCLGYARMKHFHAHFSKIQYGAKGEIRHLTFEDTVFGPEFEPLAEALIDLKLEPYLVSESAGTQIEDALFMKQTYERLFEART